MDPKEKIDISGKMIWILSQLGNNPQVLFDPEQVRYLVDDLKKIVTSLEDALGSSIDVPDFDGDLDSILSQLKALPIEKEGQEMKVSITPEIVDFPVGAIAKLLSKAIINVSTALSKLEEKKRLPKTFALPSHDVMFALLALFAGKPDRIPRKLLQKPMGERTPEEQKEANEFLDSIIRQETRTTYDEKGRVINDREMVALIADNPRVEAWAGIPESLFALDDRIREEALAIQIKRTFKAQGVRHLLGLVIGLEDAGRTGTFLWNINDHLKRLGLNKMAGGAYPPEEKRTATEIVRIFSSLFITSKDQDQRGKETIIGKKLFSMDGFYLEKFQNEIVNETIELRATDFWYKNAFQSPDGKAPQYTKLLREVVKENHRNHPLTIYLTPLLAIWWRMNPVRKLSIQSIMYWCNLDYSHKNRNRMRDLQDLEAELNYMKGKGYLGEWTNSGETPLPSGCRDPFNCILTLSPPEWLQDELKAITDKRERFTLIANTPPLSQDQFKTAFEKTGLSRRQFANTLGISPQMVSYLLKGKRKVTPEISLKVKECYPDAL